MDGNHLAELVVYLLKGLGAPDFVFLCEFSEHVGLQRTHGIANAQACLNSA